ncbi:hypothetical protein GCM10027577_34210 [Spirosoma fluminis]
MLSGLSCQTLRQVPVCKPPVERTRPNRSGLLSRIVLGLKRYSHTRTPSLCLHPYSLTAQTQFQAIDGAERVRLQHLPYTIRERDCAALPIGCPLPYPILLTSLYWLFCLDEPVLYFQFTP